MITKEEYDILKIHENSIREPLINKIVFELMQLDFFQLTITERKILKHIHDNLCWIWHGDD